MRCEDVLPLVPRYVDGELTTSQTTSFREHLLDCQSCRTRVQESEALKVWFQDPEALVGPAEAPNGFAAKVTALAFGEHAALQPLTQNRSTPPRLISEPAFAAPSQSAWALAHQDKEQEHKEQELLGFVLNMTAAAALVLLVLSFGIKHSSLPKVGKLHAENASMTQSLDSLDALNEQEADEKPGSPGHKGLSPE